MRWSKQTPTVSRKSRPVSTSRASITKLLRSFVSGGAGAGESVSAASFSLGTLGDSRKQCRICAPIENCRERREIPGAAANMLTGEKAAAQDRALLGAEQYRIFSPFVPQHRRQIAPPQPILCRTRQRRRVSPHSATARRSARRRDLLRKVFARPRQSLHVPRSRRSVRPSGHSNDECRQRFGSALKLRIEQDRGARHIRAPVSTV